MNNDDDDGVNDDDMISAVQTDHEICPTLVLWSYPPFPCTAQIEKDKPQRECEEIKRLFSKSTCYIEN